MTTTSSSEQPKLLIWLRFICAFLLYMYGMSKLARLQFALPPTIANRPVGSLTGYELTWYYYGYSHIYAYLLGLIQVAGATLLLFRKTTLLGAVLIFPVIANILMINLFVLRNDYGPEFMATFILVSMLLILWHERGTLISTFWSSQPVEPPSSRRTQLLIRITILGAVLLMTAVGAFYRHLGH
jgi:hypothetical protein